MRFRHALMVALAAITLSFAASADAKNIPIDEGATIVAPMGGANHHPGVYWVVGRQAECPHFTWGEEDWLVRWLMDQPKLDKPVYINWGNKITEVQGGNYLAQVVTFGSVPPKATWYCKLQK